MKRVTESDTCGRCDRHFKEGETACVLFGTAFHETCLRHLSWDEILDMARDEDCYSEIDVEPSDEPDFSYIDDYADELRCERILNDT